MTVFSLWDPKNPMREVDLFIEHPMAFEELWALIALKRLAGRAQDLQDIEALEKIRERQRKTGH
jgi:hypothetical protein